MDTTGFGQGKQFLRGCVQMVAAHCGDGQTKATLNPKPQTPEQLRQGAVFFSLFAQALLFFFLSLELPSDVLGWVGGWGVGGGVGGVL